MRKQFFRDAKSKLASAQILNHTDLYYNEGAGVIRELLKKESISKDEYVDLLVDKKVRDWLIEKKCICIQP